MNLKSPRTRRCAVAFGAVAAVAASGLTVGAGAAAANNLTLSPTTTDVTIVNTNPATSNATAALAYYFRTTGVSGEQRLQLISGPTGGTLIYADDASLATAATAAQFTTSLNSPTTSAQVAGAVGAANNYIGVGATVPGDYQIRVYTDVVDDNEYDAAQDQTTATMTIRVKDATGATVTSADDVSLPFSTTSSLVKGGAITSTVALSGLTTVDARGTSSSIGVLGAAVAGAVEVVPFNPTPTAVVDTEAYAGTTLTSTYATTAASPTGVWTSALVFDDDVDGDLGATYSGGTDGASGLTLLGTNSTTVSDNGVTAVTALDATTVVGSVKQTGVAVAAKTGHKSIDFVATVTDADADKSGNVVYFTIGGADAASVTTNKTTVDAAARIFSSTTDADGKARITVTDNAQPGTTYTITATSNGHTVAGGTRTVTYADAAPTSVEVTNSTSSLFPTVGQNVTVTGKVLDQFDAKIQPPNTANQQVLLFLGTTASGCVAPTVSGANVNTASQLATVANGEFSFTYTPASAPTAGHCTKFSVAYDKNSSNTVQAGEFTSTPDTIRWATTAAAASMTITAPLDNATGLALSEYDTLTTVSVTGNVKDASSTGLAYKTLTLTGGSGVYFSSSSDGSKAATSLPVTTDANGDYAAYAFFTKSGETTITATANAASKQVKVTVNHSDEDSAQAGSNNGDDFPYKVLVDDTEGTSGDTLVVTGKVVDVFGNAVRNAEVNLSTGGSTVGALAATQVTTNQDGIWATTFVTGSNQHGDVSLKATINGQNADRKPGTAWDVTGLTLNTGKYQSTGTIKVKSFVAPFVTLSGPASKAGGGVVVLKGKAKPGVVVDVYAKTSSGLVNVDTVTSDANGNYVADASITRSTVFVAKVTGAVSSQITVKVLSTVSLSGKALGRGYVRLAVTGKPGPGTATFWLHANGKWNKVTKATNYRGQVTWTFRTTRGWHAVKAMYQAPGTVASPVVSGRIFVR